MRSYEPTTGLMLELPAPPTLDAATLHRGTDSVRRQLAGERVNTSQDRQVGHNWLRAVHTAPTAQIREDIERSHAQIRKLAPCPHEDVLLIGIGGSALGLQLVAKALLPNPSRLLSLDNGDPRGIQETLQLVDPSRTTPLVVTKSGNTGETVAAMTAAKAHWQKAGLAWEDRAIAVTGAGSPLHAQAQAWRACLPLWPWVGGRFCVTSSAGLCAMQLLGLNWQELLKGAAAIDAWTHPDHADNPALALAKHWYLGQSRDTLHAIAVLAYRDRLALVGRFVQQLVMESLGKATDLAGNPVQQGLCVLGERGSTDQHSIVQYLAQGRNNAFSIIVESRQQLEHKDPQMTRFAQEHMARALGTYQTLCEIQRPCALISLPKLSAKSLGGFIALIERCIGYYAGLANLNAYDQPGVKAGKEAAGIMMQHLERVQSHLASDWQDCAQLAKVSGLSVGITWRLAMHLTDTGLAEHQGEKDPATHTFRLSSVAQHQPDQPRVVVS